MDNEAIGKVMKLVEDGKISAAEAMDLLESMRLASKATQGEAQQTAAHAAADFSASEGSHTEGASAQEPASPPPPPPFGTTAAPFGGIVEAIEKIGKDLSTGVNWTDVGHQIRSGAHRGMEFLKKTAEQVKEGNFSTIFGESEKREVILPLDLSNGKMLKVENLAGNVTVNCQASENRVTAKALFRGDSKDVVREQAESYTLVVEESDGMVWVKQPDIPHLSVQLEIELSEAVSADVRTELGDIKVKGTTGTTKIACASGNILCESIGGSLTAQTMSGDVIVRHTNVALLEISSKSGFIELEEVQGSMNIRTDSGDTVLKRCGGKSIAVEATRGDVMLDIHQPVDGTVNVRTVSGNVDMSVADNCNCRVALRAIRGETIATVDLQDAQRVHGAITGRIGAGDGSIDLSAVSGDIVLRMRDYAHD